jgi:hypothetical protein
MGKGCKECKNSNKKGWIEEGVEYVMVYNKKVKKQREKKRWGAYLESVFVFSTWPREELSRGGGGATRV